MIDMNKISPLEGYTEEQLVAEIKRRRNIFTQKNLEDERERNRIYNLPENVDKRKREADEALYSRVLSACVNTYNPGTTEDTTGTWAIYAEDRNCDFGGSHSNTYLETVTGRLHRAIRYAMTLPGFTCWGGGGYLKKTDTTIKEV